LQSKTAEADTPAYWSVTFAVDDADATAAKAEELGASARMRVGPRIAAILVVAFCLSARAEAPAPSAEARVGASEADDTPPVIRMLTPRRIRAARFVALRVRDRRSGLRDGTLAVNGTPIDAGDLAKHERFRFRARLGWEPRRRYRIRMTATDRAGNVRSFVRVVRPRNFDIYRIAIRNIPGAKMTASHAAGGCGYVHLRPRHIRVGKAPLAVGDSVMLGAAWRLTHAGFETDTRCGRNPRAGVDVLRKRKRKGTLPEIVVVALGTNMHMTSRDIAAMLRTLGPRRKLMLVTQMRRRRAVGRAPMRRAARRYPRRLSLIHWSTAARRHPSWLLGDGTHLTPTGHSGYARLLHREVWSPLRGQYIRR
jgi:hypothetical protein